MYHNFNKINEVLPNVLENIIHTQELIANDRVVKTGFEDLDSLLLGINRSELLCIAGLPKTNPDLLSLNIMSNISKTAQKELLIINLSRRTINRNLQKWLALSQQNKIINNTNFSLEEIIRKIEIFAERYPNGIVFINGLEQIFSGYLFTPQNDIEESGLTLKRLARKLDIPIVITLDLKLKKDPARVIPYLGDFGIFDIFACVADKVLTTFHYQNLSKETKQDFYINLIKNKSGKTGLFRYGVYIETEIICEPPTSTYDAGTYASY